jgi:hypothetical protein
MGRNIYSSTDNAKYIEPNAKFGLGSGLFATGWCFQKFKPKPGSSNFDMKTYHSEADRYMWIGDPDLDDLSALKKAGVYGQVAHPEQEEDKDVFDRYIHKGTQVDKCITKHAKVFPAGSEAFFYTNYGTAVDYHGPQNYTAHLNEQSIWPFYPHVPLKTPSTTTGRVITKLAGVRAPCAIAVEPSAGMTFDGTQADGHLMLHEVNMKGELNLNLSVRYKRSADAPAGLKIFAYAFAGTHHPRVELTGAAGTLSTKSVALSVGNATITSIGIHLQGPMSLFTPGKRVHVMDIFEILVKPQETYESSKVQNIVLERDGTTAKPYLRLKWDVSPAVHRPVYLPYSPLTGPFSYFNVSVGGKYVGRAHTLAYVFDQAAVKSLNIAMNTNVEVVIIGIAFDGTVSEMFKQSVTWL